MDLSKLSLNDWASIVGIVAGLIAIIGAIIVVVRWVFIKIQNWRRMKKGNGDSRGVVGRGSDKPAPTSRAVIMVVFMFAVISAGVLVVPVLVSVVHSIGLPNTSLPTLDVPTIKFSSPIQVLLAGQ